MKYFECERLNRPRKHKIDFLKEGMDKLNSLTVALTCVCFVLVTGIVWLSLVCQILRNRLEAATQETNQIRAELKKMTDQCEVFEARLEEATRRLTDIEVASKPGTLFQKAVVALVGLGVPGLVLLAVMATSGFAGAAAITSSLAFLGGPAGMISGVTALIGVGLASSAVTDWGYTKVAEAVVRGLISKGESKESIRRKLNGIPLWIITKSARDKAIAAVEGAQ